MKRLEKKSKNKTAWRINQVNSFTDDRNSVPIFSLLTYLCGFGGVGRKIGYTTPTMKPLGFPSLNNREGRAGNET